MRRAACNVGTIVDRLHQLGYRWGTQAQANERGRLQDRMRAENPEWAAEFATWADHAEDSDMPWNWVVHDGGQRRVDLHLYEALPDDSLHYGSVTGGYRFPRSALAGRGTIASVGVRWEAAEWSVRCHRGYSPRDVDHHDVSRLCARFGLVLPSQYKGASL